jgi:hypothetical protein
MITTERRLHWFMHLLLIGVGSGFSYTFDLSWAQIFKVWLDAHNKETV